MQNYNEKLVWYESGFVPVVGTSLFLEVNFDENSVDILGTNETELILQRKYWQSSTKVKTLQIYEQNPFAQIINDNVSLNSIANQNTIKKLKRELKQS